MLRTLVLEALLLPAMALPWREGSTDGGAGGESWGLDVTNVKPKSEFIKMHKTIITMHPVDLSWGTSDAPRSGNHTETEQSAQFSHDYAPIGPGIGGQASAHTLQDGTPIWLNDFLGAAHAHCYSLAVRGEPQHNFRVCNNFELQALTALVTVPMGRRILTFASSDGDDYETGKTTFRTYRYEGAVKLDSYDYDTGYDYDRWSYDADYARGSWVMQVFEGPDEETNYADIDEGMMVYCCSGEYSVYNGEGPSRRRRR